MQSFVAKSSKQIYIDEEHEISSPKKEQHGINLVKKKTAVPSTHPTHSVESSSKNAE
jgi:hypothetical protein